MQDAGTLVKNIEREIVDNFREQKPFPSPFPLDLLSQKLSSLFHNEISLGFGPREERHEDSFFKGFGSSPITSSFTLTPLGGDLFWIMPLEDIKQLLSWRKDEDGRSLELENIELIKDLYRYTQQEVASLISSLDFYKGVSPKVTEKVSLPKHGYTIDISMKHGKVTLWGRLLLAPLLERSFTSYFATRTPELRDIENYKEIPIPLLLTAGTIECTSDELASLEEGDFIRIDSPTYHPKTGKGSLKLYLEDLPLFQIKYKEGSYKIFDILYPYQERNP